MCIKQLRINKQVVTNTQLVGLDTDNPENVYN